MGAGQKTMENEKEGDDDRALWSRSASVEWDHGLIIILLLTLSAECARWCGKSR